MKKLVSDCWNICMMFINPIKNYGRFEEKNKYLKPLVVIVAGVETLKSVSGLIFLSPFKFIFWIGEKR